MACTSCHTYYSVIITHGVPALTNAPNNRNTKLNNTRINFNPPNTRRNKNITVFPTIFITPSSPLPIP